MATCKKCGAKFHTCSSCSLSYDWGWDYCSEICWKSSDEYQRDAKIVDELMCMLKDQQQAIRALVSIFNSENAVEMLSERLCS